MSSRLLFDQSFRPYLQELARFGSTKQLEGSVLYRKLKRDIDTILDHVWCEETDERHNASSDSIRAVAWNIERGMRLDAIIRILKDDSRLRTADVLMLSELDWGMARTENRFVVQEIASALRMNYAFAPCYLALTKGAGIEKDADGENVESLHGNALLSRFSMDRAHALALPNGKDKMKGAEKRIGSQRAVIADIEHPSGLFRGVSLHLDAHSSQRHRWLQIKHLLDHLQQLRPDLPVLIGGDWNTTTHDASRALYSILGYFRRVAMGVRHVVKNHYPYPERWFERRLFAELERRGYDYRKMNAAGECTLDYNIDDLAANLNMREWVPHWCFAFINWALKQTGGTCSLKLDWFAGKELDAFAPALAIGGLTEEGHRVSDHDPIVMNFRLRNEFKVLHSET